MKKERKAVKERMGVMMRTGGGRGGGGNGVSKYDSTCTVQIATERGESDNEGS